MMYDIIIKMNAFCLQFLGCTMKSLTIRGVDTTTYGALQALARKNRRSMQEQVKLILQREVSLTGGGHLSEAQQWREKLKGRDWGDIPAEIRKDRER